MCKWRPWWWTTLAYFGSWLLGGAEAAGINCWPASKERRRPPSAENNESLSLAGPAAAAVVLGLQPHSPIPIPPPSSSSSSSSGGSSFLFRWTGFAQLILPPLLILLSIGCPASADQDAKRLYEDLLTDYNRLIRPVGNNSDRLTVKLGLKLSQLIDVVSFRFPSSERWWLGRWPAGRPALKINFILC